MIQTTKKKEKEVEIKNFIFPSRLKKKDRTSLVTLDPEVVEYFRLVIDAAKTAGLDEETKKTYKRSKFHNKVSNRERIEKKFKELQKLDLGTPSKRDERMSESNLDDSSLKVLAKSKALLIRLYPTFRNYKRADFTLKTTKKRGNK